jgi:Uma2 family endonuclease
MAIQSRPLTYDDLKRLRETRDERLEIIDGALFVTPSPTPMHQRVIRRLNRLLEAAIIDADVGEYFFAPLDVKFADRTVVQPDIVAVLADKLPIVTSIIEVVPDFVVEVISSSTGAYDREKKRNTYARHGVAEYWLIDPEARSITIFSDPRESTYRSERVFSDVAVSEIIPGLTVDLKGLFAPAPGL